MIFVKGIGLLYIILLVGILITTATNIMMYLEDLKQTEYIYLAVITTNDTATNVIKSINQSSVNTELLNNHFNQVGIHAKDVMENRVLLEQILNRTK